MIPIPLNDNIRRRTFWVGTLALIVLNTLVFLYELSLGRELNRIVYLFGVIPARYTTPWLDDPKSCRPHRAHFCFHVPACWMVTPNRQHALPVRLWTKH